MLREDLRFACCEDIGHNTCTEPCRVEDSYPTCCQTCHRLKECMTNDYGDVCDGVLEVIRGEEGDVYA